MELNNVPSTARRRISKLPKYVPLIDHEYLCEGVLPFEAVAVPLRRLIRIRTRDVRFSGGDHLRAAFGVSPDTKVLALGVAKDLNLENLWGIRYESSLFDQLRQLQLAGVTAPNYSSFIDQPRTEDMVNQKRTLLYAYHLQRAGMAAALHWNIYFERDVELHQEFLRSHDEYDTICIEFGSGLRSSRAADFFVGRLIAAVAPIGRPLKLVSKGGLPYLRRLRGAFTAVTFVDSRPFHLARNRRRLLLGNDGEMIELRDDARTKREVARLFQGSAEVRRAFEKLLAAG